MEITWRISMHSPRSSSNAENFSLFPILRIPAIMQRMLNIILHIIMWRIMRRILRILAGMWRIGNAEVFSALWQEGMEFPQQGNSTYNTAITQGKLLDRHPGQGMQNWKNNIIKTPYFGQYLENWNTRKLIGLNSDSMNEDAKISFCAANVIWITLCMTTHCSTFNSMWPSDVIWRQDLGQHRLR